ncbi:major facilitator superfamily domain-containing protein [Lineolata rhizophorae]|uniref:Major facilitator superfamily domain-containing protein n=1 Tax=Lineolata rhizophorae TaxID=578093 RepID=A0A6A6PCD1_9PEZI|nr:major facilitator superfamily domain-containing protein [Lineolata rhizophorae]
MSSDDGSVPDRGPVVFGVSTAMICISTVFVSLRMASRTLIVHRISWDDYFMILAWAITFGLSFSICWGTSVGLGRHERDVPPVWDPPLKKAEYAFSVLYNPSLMATKTSILVFFLTLSTNQKIFKWACWATLFVVNAAGLALTFLNIFQCVPVADAFKTPQPRGANCTDVVTLYLSSAPVNIITDLAILFLPMPILTSMRLPKKQKVILVITFGFGIFVAIVDVVRIAYLQQAFLYRLNDVQMQQDESNMRKEQSDFSWYAAYSFMWSNIEANVGIMCGCVPGLKPLVSKFLPHFIRDVGETEKSISPAGNTANTSDHVEAQGNLSLPQPENAPQRPTPAHTSPSPAGRSGNGNGEEVDMLDFLTTPEGLGGSQGSGGSGSSPGRMDMTTMTSATANTNAAAPTFFDFVSMKKKKSIVFMNNRESVFPIAMVTVLFFVWGFAYGLLDVLNQQFQQISYMSSGKGIGIHSAYYAGYFIGPITFGRLALIRWGFKSCYIIGLSIYATGTLVFWPSAVLTSFSAFLISNFIVGLGLSTLELSANPFTTLCGPPQYAEIRLNLSQAVQAIGTIVSPLLAKKVLFGPRTDAPSLVDVQWTYLGIALFTIILAVGYYYVPLPDATDAELDDAAQRADGANQATIAIPFLSRNGRSLTISILALTLALGIFSQFCYVGGQESLSTSFAEYLEAAGSTLDKTSHQAIGHTAFAVSRFLAALANIFLLKPRHLLALSYAGCILFAALCMKLPAASPRGTSSAPGPAAAIVLLYFFEGPIFSLVYASALRGLGARTKNAAALMTAAIAGGAVWPPVMHAVAERADPLFAYAVVLAAFAAGAAYAVYLEAVPKARRQVDPVRIVGLGDGDGRAGRRDSVLPGLQSRGPSRGGGGRAGLPLEPEMSGGGAGGAGSEKDPAAVGAGDGVGHGKKMRWGGGVVRKPRWDSVASGSGGAPGRRDAPGRGEVEHKERQSGSWGSVGMG